MARLKLIIFALFNIVHALIGAVQTNDSITYPNPDQVPIQFTSNTVPAWQFYYGVDSATHQTNFNKWSSAGYRLISLSAYGTPPDVHYAAVWVQRSGPAWQAIHNADGAAYQAWFDKYGAQGYVSTLITATGPRGSAVYAGVMEKITGVSSWIQRCDMTASDYASNIAAAYGNRRILKSFREYGTPSDRRYCAVWHANSIFDKWDSWISQSYTDYQNTFNSEITKRYWRPSYVTLSEDQRVSSSFVDTYLGPAWLARHGLTAADLQAEYQKQAANGLYLINLQGGGSGSNARYAGIWAAEDIPQAREWRAVGSVTGFKDNAGAMVKADGIMKGFMQNSGVRQAQLSIGKNGNILLERAYSWSEPARHTTQPSDPFLLASVSKMFCAAAIQSLYDSGKLLPNATAYPLLGYTNPTDPRLNQITIQQLITHAGGYNRTSSHFDPVFSMRAIALQQSGGSRPATKKDVVDYMFKRPLDFNPGSGNEYSNYGFLLLSYIVEHVTGQDYVTYLKNTFPYDVRTYTTRGQDHVNDPVTQESLYLGLSALEPTSPHPVATVYGGDGMYKESYAGGGSLAASASTLVKFIQSHAVWDNGPRRPGAARSGSEDGASTWANSRWDGVDWALVVNTRDWPPGQNPTFDMLAGTVVPQWLDTNPTV